MIKRRRGQLDGRPWTRRALAAGMLIPYEAKILRTGPVALWSMSETGGTTAVDATGNGYSAPYSNVTLNATTFPDGTPAGLWVPASNSRVQTYSAGLNAAVNKQEGSMACWLKVRAASLWTDSTLRWVYEMFVDTNNRIRINRPTGANALTFEHRGAGTIRAYNAVLSPATWFHVALTWSSAGSAVRAYVNGVDVSGNLGAPGTYTGAPANTSMEIGNFVAVGANAWDGYIKYMGLWSRPLIADEIASFVPAGFLV